MAVSFGLDIGQFKASVVDPVVRSLGLPGDVQSRINGTTGIMARESLLKYKRQLGGGPAVGLGQIEPATHDSLYADFLAYNDYLTRGVRQWAPAFYGIGSMIGHGDPALIFSDAYSAACVSAIVRWKPGALPAATDATAWAQWWKVWYNSSLGSGDVDDETVSIFAAAIAA